jgi:hypothetical protein
VWPHLALLLFSENKGAFMGSRKRSYSRVLILILALACANIVAAQDSQKSDLDPIDWDNAIKHMAILTQIGFHPFLMPLIMKNRDMIELSKQQLEIFREWRSKYRVPMLHAMNRIIQERLAFQRLSLDPKTRNEVLRAKEEEIFKLYRKVLQYQLSCRRNILDTFTEEQWDNFRFVLAENGYTLD